MLTLGESEGYLGILCAVLATSRLNSFFFKCSNETQKDLNGKR